MRSVSYQRSPFDAISNETANFLLRNDTSAAQLQLVFSKHAYSPVDTKIGPVSGSSISLSFVLSWMRTCAALSVAILLRTPWNTRWKHTKIDDVVAAVGYLSILLRQISSRPSQSFGYLWGKASHAGLSCFWPLSQPSRRSHANALFSILTSAGTTNT